MGLPVGHALNLQAGSPSLGETEDAAVAGSPDLPAVPIELAVLLPRSQHARAAVRPLLETEAPSRLSVPMQAIASHKLMKSSY